MLSKILFTFFILNFSILRAEEPFDIYQKALQEKDSFLQAQGFNKTIDALLENTQDSFEKDLLLGKSLVQLRQYPLALYYYLKALKKNPGSIKTQELINEAIRAGNLPATLNESILERPSRFLMGALLLIGFLWVSLWIFFKKKTLLLASFPFAGWFLYLLFLDYRSPILAVVLHASILSKDAGKGDSVYPAPIPAGSIVTVLDVVDQGAWVKVRFSNGIMGYLAEHAVRIVD